MRAGFGSFADAYEGLLCDLWGVLHNGVEIFAPARDALVRFREERGGRVLLLSNAPRPSSSVRAHLQDLGLPASAYDSILTSGDMTRRFLEDKAPARLFHLGPPRDRPLLEGLPITLCAALEDSEIVLCTGLFDDANESAEDYAPLLKEMRQRALPMICANPDRVVMRGEDCVPCAGALAEAYQKMEGAVLFFGKPHPPTYARAAQIFREMGVPNIKRVLAIGDGLETDMLGALHAELDMIFISSGIHARELGQHPSERALAALFQKANLPRQPNHVMPHLFW